MEGVPSITINGNPFLIRPPFNESLSIERAPYYRMTPPLTIEGNPFLMSELVENIPYYRKTILTIF